MKSQWDSEPLMKENIKNNLSTLWSSYANSILLVLIFSLYLISRLWMYLKYGMTAFGYDTGIYRHIVIGYFERLGDAELPAFGFATLSNMLRLLGFGVDDIIFQFYIFLSLLIFFALYFVVKRFFDFRVALVTVFLFSTSVLQFEFYWWYYYRNMLALLFILISFLLVHKKSYLLIPILAVLAVIHPLSLVPLAFALLMYMAWSRDHRKFLFISGLVGFGLAVMINMQELLSYLTLLFDFGARVSGSPVWRQHELTGQFVDASFFISHSFWLVPFAFLGIYTHLKKSILFTFFLMSNLLLVYFKFLLYRRFFVYIDLVLIMSAGLGLVHVISQISSRQIRRIIFISVLGLSLAHTSMYIFSKQPLIQQTDLFDIQFLSKKIPDNAYLLTISSYYAPWLYGFTSFDIIAPGMFEHNLWNEEEWYIFWYAQSSEERHALLSRYGDRPVYIYVGPYFQNFGDRLIDDPQFTHVDTFLWAYKLSDT